MLLLKELEATGADSARAVQWTTNYYAVTGATTREIRMSINQSRPWKERLTYDGFTEWKVNWRFRSAREGDDCRLIEFQPSAIITTTLPRWTPPPEASPEVREAWKRYMIGLVQHETVHGRFAYAAVEDMKKKIASLPPMPCEQLKERVNQLANGVMDDYRQREKDFDKRTNHGATQGARLH